MMPISESLSNETERYVDDKFVQPKSNNESRFSSPGEQHGNGEISTTAEVYVSKKQEWMQMLLQSSGLEETDNFAASDVLHPGSSPEEILARLRWATKELNDKLEIAIARNPDIVEHPLVSSSSLFSRHLHSRPGAPTYRHQLNHPEDYFDMITDWWKVLDAVQDEIANPKFTTMEPESSTDPLPSVPAPILEYLTMKGSKRANQTSEIVLRFCVAGILRTLSTLPEHDNRLPLLHSTVAFAGLHLYEVKWNDAFLDASVGMTISALQDTFTLPTIEMIQSTPTTVRNFAYAVRLLAQRNGNINMLQSVLTYFNNWWEIIVNNKDAFGVNMVEFVREEFAVCLLDRYRSIGSLEDLDSSIEHLNILLGNEKSAVPVFVLGTAYYERFLHCGNVEDLHNSLDLAYMACKASGSSVATEDPDAAAGHHLFALGLFERFKMTLDLEDLDRAVQHCKKAIDHLPPLHPFRPPYKSSLALILATRYEETRNRKDMESALQIIQAAVEESQGIVGRHFRVPLEAVQGYLAVMSLDAKTANIPAIEDGIRMITRSRKEFPGATHIECRIESYLSKSFLHLFRAASSTTIGVPDDDKRDYFDSALEHAILAFKKAPDESPYRYQFGLDMGCLILEKYKSGHSPDCDEAIAEFCTTALSSTWPSIRLKAAIKWADALEATDPEGTLDALREALEILPSLASPGVRMPTQVKILTQQKTAIPQRAAMHAIGEKDMVLAVSCLEKGRNIMWAQALKLRAGHMLSPADDQQKEFKRLAQSIIFKRESLPRPTLQELEEKFQHYSPSQQKQLSSLLGVYQVIANANNMNNLAQVAETGVEHVNRHRAMLEEASEQCAELFLNASLHSAAKRWNELLSEFNELKGALSFDEAMQRDLVPILKGKDGLVVVLNTYGSRCEGVVISTQADSEELAFHHVPFPAVSPDELYAWVEGLREGMEGLSDGNITLDRYESAFLFPVLRGLWRGVARPLLEHFSQLSGGDMVTKRRVWWYPTGRMMFVPVHAASPCEGNKPGLLDLIISSYIPSIHSLVRASKSPSLPLNILAIGQPETSGLSRLPYAEKEINALKRMLRDSPDRLTSLIGEEGKIFPVISSIPSHTGLHLSCHAIQDEQYPFNSAFYLDNGRLKLSEIMRLDLSLVQLAILSACLTSAGDAGLPDECIHLAAGMQFAGVRSVVATMWSVEDRISAAMSSKVYEHLLRNGIDRADTTESAEALHEAIGAVKRAGTPLALYVPFIHLGI